jgi:hypothetical protein
MAAACSSAVPNPITITPTPGAKWCDSGTKGAGGASLQTIAAWNPAGSLEIASSAVRSACAARSLFDEQKPELHDRADLV